MVDEMQLAQLCYQHLLLRLQGLSEYHIIYKSNKEGFNNLKIILTYGYVSRRMWNMRKIVIWRSIVV